MNTRRNSVLIGLTLLLLLFATVLVWPTLANLRNHSHVEEHATFASPKIQMAHGHGPDGPFAALGLTPDQHKQIEAIMQETIQQERAKFKPSGNSEKSGTKTIQLQIPMERIRAVLNPEQRVKLAEMEKQMKDHFANPSRHDAAVPPPNGSSSPMVYIHGDR